MGDRPNGVLVRVATESGSNIASFKRRSYREIVGTYAGSEVYSSACEAQYMVYFNDARPHQGIGQMLPANCALRIDRSKPIRVTPVLGGLHADYRRAA